MKGTPDKIWINQYHSVWLQDPKSTEYTEYVRKDAFIEKACKYLEPNLKIILCGDKIDTDKFIEDFKKYMER